MLNKMKITFIQTGGTIDKDYPKTQKGWAFEIAEPAVRRILEKLNPSFEYEIISVLKKDSLEITDEDRLLLLKTCQDIDNEQIIITHGTDTMLKTAEFLSAITDKIIVLTGAMLPERFTNSDAPVNLGTAISGVQTLHSGIYVAMYGLILPYHKMTRNPETGKFIEKF
jgi:L-asparaginase